jgi:hypothetical protein
MTRGGFPGFFRRRAGAAKLEPIEASWGDPSETGSVWELDPTPGATVTVRAQRSALQAAPEAFHFALQLAGFATNTPDDPTAYDRSFHDKYVFWDYGDSYRFTAPEQVLSLDAADGGHRADSRYSRGPLGAHTYRSAGAYTVRVAVVEPASGIVGFATYRIGGADADTPAVRAPETVFPGARTLFVDANGLPGGYPNAPPGAIRFSNVQAAVEHMAGRAVPHRVVLERGQTHVLRSGVNLVATTTSQHSFRIEARSGPGDKPVLALDPDGFGRGGLVVLDNIRQNRPSADCDFVFSGVVFRGLWNSTTESGAAAGFILSARNGAGYFLHDDCTYSGWSIVQQFDNPTRAISWTVNDTVITNWADYGIAEGSDRSSSAILGARVSQDIDALSGGPRREPPAHNMQGPIRIAATTRSLIWATDVFSRNGWFPNGPIFETQPGIRWGDSARVPGARLACGACVMESPSNPMTLSNGDGQGPSVHVNAVLDGNVFVTGFRGFEMIGITFGGSTWRNNVLISPDVERDARLIGGIEQWANITFAFKSTPAATRRATGRRQRSFTTIHWSTCYRPGMTRGPTPTAAQRWSTTRRGSS